MKPAKLLAPAALLVSFAFAGCGPSLPETVKVTGKVVANGKPIENAQIGFVPTSTDPNARPALGTTDANGAFTLRTYVAPGAEADGAMVGDYTVTVQKTDVPADPAELAKMFSKNPGFVPPRLLPASYASPTTSPLKASVTEAGPNDFALEVQEEAKGKKR